MMRTFVLLALVVLGLGWPTPASAESPADHAESRAAARRLLLSARFKEAAAAFRALARAQPSDGEAHYGLVVSLLKADRAREADKAASGAMVAAPGTPGALAAAGVAAFRRAELPTAERLLRLALRANAAHAGALKGLAALHALQSQRRTARRLLLDAFGAEPDDPELMLAYADTLEGAARLEMMEHAHAALDPTSEEAQGLAVDIAVVRASLDRELARLTSPYSPAAIPIHDTSRDSHGPRPSLKVTLNGRHPATLLLDTGASGISLKPRTAARAGLLRLGEATAPIKGIGIGRPRQAGVFLASEFRVGAVAWADMPVLTVSTVSDDLDGVMGADVFRQFLVTLDFRRRQVRLEPRAEGPGGDDAPRDAPPPPEGFARVWRFGNHLAVEASVNGARGVPFLLDSGAAVTIMDETTGRSVATVLRGGGQQIYGIQGMARASSTRQARVEFLGRTMNNAALTVLDLTPLSDDLGIRFGGIVGMPLLAQAVLTIDYRDANVRIGEGLSR